MTPITRRFTALLLTALSLAVVPGAHADSTARITASEPAGAATLGRQESFWVRIEYNSDEPINLWARPYLNGTQVKKTMTNASLTYTGSGQALGWFALTEPGDVDEVRVFAGGGKPFREWELARLPVQLRWTNASSSPGPQPQWIPELLEAERVRYREDAQRRASEPTPVGDVVLFNGFMLAMLALLLAGIGVPGWAIRKWRGGWRIAAAVPLVVIAFVVLRIIVDTARDPTSHNLWPFEILQFGIVALAIIGVLRLARRFMGVQA